MNTNYRTFLIEIYNYPNGTQKCYAFLNNEPIFATFSELDNLNALEKIKIKIDNYYNNKQL